MIISSNKISIDFNGANRVAEHGAPVQNAMEGITQTGGIEYTKDGTVQKDMEKSIVYTGASQTMMAGQVAEIAGEAEFDPADFISQSMTGKDAKELEKEGTPLEEYEASTLQRALERVKSQRQENKDALENEVEKGKEKQEFFDEIEEKIEAVSQMMAGLSQVTAGMASYLLQNMDLWHGNGSPALCATNIQGSMAAKVDTLTASVPFEQIQDSVTSILQDSENPVAESMMEDAKWLYENNIPVTRETVETYEKLQELVELSPEVIRNRMIDEVMDGKVPDKADLSHISRGEAAQRLEELVQVDEATLLQTFPDEVQQITARRQLEEIRLQMTVDAARTMENKGIHLDVKNLQQIVEELRGMEEAISKEYLAKAEVPETSENVQVMTDTLHATKSIQNAPVSMLGVAIQRVDMDTLSQLAEVAQESRTANLSEYYEKVGTEVRKDLGDSMAKAFGNVDAILQELDMETTAYNQRAVRILGYNQMALTKENIESMKAYDAKVTSLIQAMKPQVVAELIRRGENPLNMSLDELNEKVTEISDEIMPEDISFRKYLWKLDHAGAISEAERKSMIGIYRLLDKVEKSDGGVIGKVIKDGRELSFSSLLSAVRTRKAEGIDTEINDDFGGLQEVRNAGIKINDQIDAAFAEHVVNELKDSLSPKVFRQHEDWMGENLEVILDECENAMEAVAENEDYYEKLAEELRAVAAQGEESIRQACQQLELPTNLLHIQLMTQYMEQGSKEFLKKMSSEEGEVVVENFDNPDALLETFENVDERISKEIEQEKSAEDLSYENIKDLALMAGNVSFFRNLRSYQKYEVPIYTEQGMMACSVTMKTGNGAAKGTVEITVDSGDLGLLQASLKVSGRQVSGFVTAEQGELLENGKQWMDSFRTDLERNGFSWNHENFAMGKRAGFHIGDKLSEATNKELYQVAKCFLKSIGSR